MSRIHAGGVEDLLRRVVEEEGAEWTRMGRQGMREAVRIIDEKKEDKKRRYEERREKAREAKRVADEEAAAQAASQKRWYKFWEGRGREG